ncbi:MAG: c-type cytochrome [Candidatus Kapabacteria bacterium]|nr:c-type cytochrome [Candidatus Kapabacteria bacterium]
MTKVKDELFHHNFDGIQEFDNPLPPWWLYLFFITIVWAVVYFFYYHIGGFGDSSITEYAKEMAAVKVIELKFDKADFVVIKDAPAIDEGKALFIKNCKTCHGEFGEGLVGPNLTDKFWIHGGSFENIVTTIVNGVPNTAMPSWKASLKKADILKVTSFITTLQGTSPANAKAPQGDAYNPQ